MSAAAVLTVSMLVVSVLTAAAVTGLLQRLLPALLLRARLVDVPGPRSSHEHPTPRGGGLAVVAGLVAGSLVWALGRLQGSPPDASEVLVLLVAGTAAVAGSVGLADDVLDLPAPVRAVAQLVVGAGAGVVLTQVAGLSVLWVPVAALCLAAYVNAVNFMDGVDTITAGHGVVCGLSYAAAGVLLQVPGDGPASGPGPGTSWLLPAGLLLAAVSAVFSLVNGVSGRRATLFLGDVGSCALGAAIAVLAGAGFLTGLPLLTALAPLTVWLADTGHTLLLRAAAGERVTEAHRTHAYQRLVDTGWSHRRVGAAAAAATALCGVVGAAVVVSQVLRLPAVVVLLLVGCGWVRLPAWRGCPSPWGAVARSRVRGGSR